MSEDVTVVIGVGGMGLAIARRVASGRALLLADFNEATLEAAAQQLRGEGHDVTTRVVDVSERDSVVSLVDAAGALGRVTQVAHTAGLSPVQASPAAVLRVDLLGAAYVLDEFPRVIAPGGAGVVIASMAGHPWPPLPAEHEHALAATESAKLLDLPFLATETMEHPGLAYVAAKRGNLLRVQAAADAWGERGARINAISPGVISTPMGQQELSGPAGDHIRTAVQMSGTKRLGTPDDIAAAAAFLLGRESSFITGSDLLVDGGVTAATRTQAAQATT